MRNLILLILAALLFAGCGDGASSTASATAETFNNFPSPGGSEPDDSTPDTPSEPAVSMALVSTDLYLYKDDFEAQNIVEPKTCGNKCFTDADMKLYYDSDGYVVAAESMDVSPDYILDDWSIQDVSPDVAYAAGALYKWYSKVFYQDVEQGSWFDNRWKTKELIKTISGEYIAIDTTGAYHPLSSVINDINYADEIIIRDFDAYYRTAVIEATTDVAVSWLTNYFNSAKDWLPLNGIWYSWNGYEYDEVTLTEEANAMWSWNVGPYVVTLPYAQSPTIISAGTYNNALYWIECNSGVVVKYTPSDDSLIPVFGIYSGDGYRTTGLARRDTIKPEIIGNLLYVNNDGSVNSVDLDSGIVSLVFAGEGEVVAW